MKLVLYISRSSSDHTYARYYECHWDDEAGEWRDNYWSAGISDPFAEEYSSPDDSDGDLVGIIIRQRSRSIIKNVMKNGMELDKDAIDRINAMLEKGTLSNVKLLDVD